MKCDSCQILLVLIAVLLVSLIIAYQFVEPPPPDEIRIAIGREGGGYHTFALEYQKLLKAEEFKLDIQQTAGSIEVLQQLKSGKVSVGLVQGGTGKEVPSEGLQSLGSLFYEPIWVFYRKALSVEYLFDLHGKRIAVGEEGSGTRPIAVQLLQDNQVMADNSNFVGLSSNEAAQQLVSGEIDAAFFVMSPKSNIILELLENQEIELFSFKRHIAYSSRYSFLTDVKIGEGIIDLKKNIPEEDKTLLVTTASLVARHDLHDDIVYLLLNTVIKVHKAGGMLEKEGQFPSTQFVEFPMNKNATHYLVYGRSWLQSIFPLWLASALVRLKIMLIPLIAILLPLLNVLKGTLPLYRWSIRFKIFRWYANLREIDNEIYGSADLETIKAKIQRLKNLQKELFQQVSVPLSYMGEFYGLRMHIQLVLERLEKRQALKEKHEEQQALKEKYEAKAVTLKKSHYDLQF
ncbi:TAXI family TRAP transporter solute-binding subunit [Candidatus Marithioploca araucensis]|uniref:TAXI family TRAP transporter solute-binding subunit n=1 Tax=Candidatus Marithioploca araucensis TaxID=70273 RepID=A0ABT7VQI9_9GAMM|nr:TAXI family TRAP transporter solute-binding subunit [Candidatus Marithioploca araucensis]